MRPLAVLLTGLKTMTILEEVKMTLDAWVAVGKDVQSFPEPFGRANAFLQILGAIIAGPSTGSVDLNQSQPSLLAGIGLLLRLHQREQGARYLTRGEPG